MKLREIPRPVVKPFRHREPVLKRIDSPPPEKTEPATPEPSVVAAVQPNEERQTPPPRQKKQALEVPPEALPQPYKPVDVEQALMSANPTVAMVMLRQLRDMQGEMPNSRQGPLAAMEKLQRAVNEGTDITALSQEISLYITGQAETRELMSALSDKLDDNRLTDIYVSRSKFEDFLHACGRRSDLSITESIAVQAYFDNQVEKIFARRAKRANSIEGGREPAELLERANVPSQLQRNALVQKFNEATPQEREILRKLGFKIDQSIIAARVTTTTQTVEVVQKDGTG